MLNADDVGRAMYEANGHDRPWDSLTATTRTRWVRQGALALTVFRSRLQDPAVRDAMVAGALAYKPEPQAWENTYVRRRLDAALDELFKEK